MAEKGEKRPIQMEEITMVEVKLSAKIDERMADEFKAVIEQLDAQSGVDISVIDVGKERLDSYLSGLFAGFGMPASLDGHAYLKAVIALALSNPTYLRHNITSKLYPEVASVFDTRATRVERAIRHAIAVMCDRGNYDNLLDAFGSCISDGSGKPTNSEFIARVVELAKTDFLNTQSA